MTIPILISDNNEQLNGILKDQRFADKKVCVVSVAGAFRSGKSFILNFFLRYLRGQANGTENWMDMDGQLDGFHWRDGVDPDTQGILIWPELFLLKDGNGEEVVVILMDTQGINGSDSTFKNCVNIFALSTMISSVQVFNIQNKIEEPHLDQLKYFTNYAQLALKNNDNGTAPYQSLLFLVRDWCNLRDGEYGAIGGQRYLDKLLEIESKEPELQQLRRDIRSTFDKIGCFLMPHPGLEMTTNPDFRGELDIINPQFIAQLRSLVTHLFHPNNLVVKQINGHQINCIELADYIDAYSKVFKGTDLPEPMTAFTAMANFTNSVAVDNAKAVYEQGMGEVCGGDKLFLSPAELRAGHERCRAEALQEFNTKKMGGSELEAQFVKKLEEDIQEAFKSFERSNNSASNSAAFDSTKELYKQEMEKVCGVEKPILSCDELRAEHERCHAKALRAFNDKKMGGPELTAQFVKKLNTDIQEAFKSFVLINENKKKTADATNSAAVDSAKELYKREMKKVCNGDKPFLDVDELYAGHERCRAKALKEFDAKKMGGTELTKQFVDKLEEYIQEAFDDFERSNDSKKAEQRERERAEKERERADRERERADRERKERKKAEKEKKNAWKKLAFTALALTGPIGAVAATTVAVIDHLANSDDENDDD